MQKFSASNPLKIAVLPGDGIGAEVCHVALPVFQALNIPHQLFFGEIGWECWKKYGDPVPQKTWDLINETDTTLLGAITSKPLHEAEAELPRHLQDKNHEYVSPVIQLRQKLGLFANIRPVWRLDSDAPQFRVTVIRENMEGLYAGLDFGSIDSDLKKMMITHRKESAGWSISDLSQATVTMRLQTHRALARLFKFTFEYAAKENFEKVTLADKPNVLRQSGAFAAQIFQNIAKDFPHIKADIQNVDAVAMRLLMRPQSYGVIVAENMFGDILSDIAAGVMGGLGVAPSANVGTVKNYFEPVHGSAPIHAGKNRVNPSAMFLSVALLLKEKGFIKESEQICRAVGEIISEKKTLTYDFGGTSSTQQMATAIIDRCTQSPPIDFDVKKSSEKIALLTTGNEITSGEVNNSNGQTIANFLSQNGLSIGDHLSVGDDEAEINKGLSFLSQDHAVIIVTGGLGPTSDDRTRFALSHFLQKPLVFSHEAWNHVATRLDSFELIPTENNKQQALFPEGASLLPNHNGTAWGCFVDGRTKIFLLPGPPQECLPMFEEKVLPELLQSLKNRKKILRWKLLGPSESEIGEKIDRALAPFKIQAGFRWHYPFIEIKIPVPEILDAQKIEEALKPVVNNNLISRGYETPSELLKHRIKKNHLHIQMSDSATQGCFKRVLGLDSALSLKAALENKEKREIVVVRLCGLEELNHKKEFKGLTTISVTVSHKNKSKNFETKIPFRGREVIDFAIEFSSAKILEVLSDEYQ